MNVWKCSKPFASSPRARAAAFALASLVLGSCEDGPQGPTLIEEPLGPFPATIEQLGIHLDPADLEQVDPRAVRYEPAHALWTNGSAKLRFVVLPEGTTIEASDPETWEFPVGTLVFKTFAYPRADGSLRPVETRVMRLAAGGEWEFATYRWAADGRDGARAAERLPEEVPVDAFGESFTHTIPSERQCRQCHAAGSRRVLGMNDRSLAEPGPSGESELDRLVAAGVVELGRRAPLVIPEQADADTRAVIAYVWANCTHCHNGAVGTNTAFDMRPEVFLENTIDRDTASEASSAGVRIVPGDPDSSVVLSAMLDVNGARPMPPVGVDRRDTEAIELIRRWIAALPPTTP